MGQPLIFLQLAKWLMDRRTGVQAALFCTEHALLRCHADHETRVHSRTDCKSASAAAVHTADTNSYVDTDYDLAKRDAGR